MPATALPIRVLLLGLCFLLSQIVRADVSSVTADAPPVVPLRGLAYTQNDILEVRRQVRENGANAGLVAAILKLSDEWVARSQAEVDALIPPPGATFAYGSAGDPKTNQAWPRFGRSDNMCSFDRPGTVRSPHTGDIYGDAKPGEPYYDDGKGWTRESDGQVFYFKGVWHAWVTDRLHDAVDNLAIAYMLTGRADYAERALYILDRLATLRVSLPLVGNSVADWPHAPGDEAKGFFHYMGNIANQRAINTAFAFDLLGNANFATAPSPSVPGRTVRENISRDYFGIYERFYYDRLRSLTNHGIILVANLITQGVLFGRADMLEEGLVGLQGFFDNTINRDGDYMEVSGGYGRLGRDYGSRLIAPLANYSPANYPASARMPALPGGLRPGDDPRWYNTAVRMLYRLPILGRYPQYGDMGMDRAILLDKDNEWLGKHRAMFLRILYRQTTRPEWKREIESLYPRVAKQNNKASLLLEDILLHGPSLWVEPPAPAAGGVAVTLGENSDLMAAKGIAVLRGGQKKDARALFIRGGFNSWHGHDDQMSVVPYGHGMVLFGEYGYRWSGTPDNFGWGSRSISHNTVVVNEDLPAPYLYKGFSANIPAAGASVTAYVPSPDSPAKLVEMHNPSAYSRANLADYRRSAWLVDIDASRYYFVDIFHVLGGRIHDYAWNAPYPDPQHVKSALTLEGVKPAPRPGVWTLASVANAKLRNEEWNKPGQSWGERLNGENGLITPLPGEKKLPVSKWNPAPGNGYGMIWDVKLEETNADWTATWPLPDNRHQLRAHMINYDGMTAISALSPSMTPENNFRMIIARRTGADLRSRFVNVVQVGAPNRWPVSSVEKLPVQAKVENDAVALRIALADAGTDLLVASRTAQSVSTPALSLTGRQAFARLDANGKLTHLTFQESSEVKVAGWTIGATAPSIRAKVVGVYPGADESRVELDTALPSGAVLADATALFDSEFGGGLGYSHNEYYRVESVRAGGSGRSSLVFREQSLITASLNVEELEAGTGKARLFWEHSLAGKPGTLAYRGHGVVPAGRPADKSSPVVSLIRKIESRTVEFSNAEKLKAGQRLDVLAVKPGDSVTIPLTVVVRPVDGRADAWRISTTQPLRIAYPTAAGVRSVEVPAGESVMDDRGVVRPVPRA